MHLGKGANQTSIAPVICMAATKQILKIWYSCYIDWNSDKYSNYLEKTREQGFQLVWMQDAVGADEASLVIIYILHKQMEKVS